MQLIKLKYFNDLVPQIFMLEFMGSVLKFM